jgi:hypothetical protein
MITVTRIVSGIAVVIGVCSSIVGEYPTSPDSRWSGDSEQTAAKSTLICNLRKEKGFVGASTFVHTDQVVAVFKLLSTDQSENWNY